MILIVVYPQTRINQCLLSPVKISTFSANTRWSTSSPEFLIVAGGDSV